MLTHNAAKSTIAILFFCLCTLFQSAYAWDIDIAYACDMKPDFPLFIGSEVEQNRQVDTWHARINIREVVCDAVPSFKNIPFSFEKDGGKIHVIDLKLETESYEVRFFIFSDDIHIKLF